MREKNIRRAAEALYMSQGDDKNQILGSRISDPEAKKLVKDQGRVLVVLEKLILPKGKDAYTKDEMYELLYNKLVKKGHRIQGDDEEDTPEYAAEKKAAIEARSAMVPGLFGKTLQEAVDAKNEEKNAPEADSPDAPIVDGIKIQDIPLEDIAPWTAEDEKIKRGLEDSETGRTKPLDDVLAESYADFVDFDKFATKDQLVAVVAVAGFVGGLVGYVLGKRN